MKFAICCYRFRNRNRKEKKRKEKEIRAGQGERRAWREGDRAYPKLFDLRKDVNPFFPQFPVTLEDAWAKCGGFLKLPSLNQKREVFLPNVKNVVNMQQVWVLFCGLQGLLVPLTFQEPRNVIVQVTGLRHHDVLGADHIEDVLAREVFYKKKVQE